MTAPRATGLDVEFSDDEGLRVTIKTDQGEFAFCTDLAGGSAIATDISQVVETMRAMQAPLDPDATQSVYMPLAEVTDCGMLEPIGHVYFELKTEEGVLHRYRLTPNSALGLAQQIARSFSGHEPAERTPH